MSTTETRIDKLVTCLANRLLPLLKPALRLLARGWCRFRAYNTEVLNAPGPVLLLPNHVSWLDWLFIGACLEGDWRFVVSRSAAQRSLIHRFMMINRYTFLVDTDSPYGFKYAAEFLAKGGRLVLFPEGRVSRTTSLMRLFDGTGLLLQKAHAKVITCYLRGAQWLPGSPNVEKKCLFQKVTAHFSEVLTPPVVDQVSGAAAREQLTNWLRDRMVAQQFEVEMAFGPRTVLAAIAETSHRLPKHVVLEDVSYSSLTYRQLLAGVDLFAQRLGPRMAGEAERVGLLLPNVNGMPMALLALWQLGKVPAILNFSTGTATMLVCSRLAGLKQIVTSRAFIERANLDVQPFCDAGGEMIYLEDLRAEITLPQKLVTLFRHTFLPGWATQYSPFSNEAVVLFTSGSEGTPKGVSLTHANLLANIRQMLLVTDLGESDRIFNCLPLFHSFGLTVGTLLPLVRGMHVFLFPSPLQYKLVPTAFYDRDCTVLLSTNTFLNGYVRKAHPYDFRTLRYLFAGAEKVQQATAQAWFERFGVRILEGYGATECGPCVSVNTPLEHSAGTAGRILPSMEYRLEPVEGVTEGGRLFVRGPNVMQGYLNADANAAFQALGGWYDTGDIVSVNEQRYVRILGRVKRFAKVSGEMVSLTAVEDALAGAFKHFGLRTEVAVITRPDEDKGEALVAVTNEPRVTLEEIRAAIRAKGLTNLCAPRELKVVREIPKLGTGKVNHRELEKLV